MKVIVYHTGYGCDTGCCGHAIVIEDGRRSFEFEHPLDTKDLREWAEELIEDEFGKNHGLDLDWENCQIIKDC